MSGFAIFILFIGIGIKGSEVPGEFQARKSGSAMVNLDSWYDASVAMQNHFVDLGYDCLRQKMIFPKAVARFFRDEMGRKFPGTWLCSVFASKDEAIFESYGMTGLAAYVGSMYVRCANCECGRNFQRSNQ